jgi:hypothetical protein
MRKARHGLSDGTLNGARENEALRDGIGLGVLLLLIVATNLWGALLGA